MSNRVEATTAALTTIHRPCRAGRHVNDVAPYGAAVGHDRHFDLLITLFLIASVHGNRLERAQARDRGSRLRRVAYRPAPSGALMETRTVDRILTGSACAWTKAGNDVLGASVHRKVEPFADAAVAPITRRRRRRAVLGGLLLTIAALAIAVPLRGRLLDSSAAGPDLRVPGRAPGPLLVQDDPPGSEQRAQEDRRALFDALNQVLEDTQAGYEKLTRATATMAADTEVLAGHIRLNEQLNESLARAEASRQAALAEAERTRAEMARKLGAATDAVAQSRADLAGLHKELEANDNELAAAKSAREEAERARQVMSNEAESLRSEAARARDELSAAKTEIARLKSANAELEKEIASWRTSWTSAIETARHNPIMLGEMIEEVNAALDLAPPEETTPAASASTMPVPPEKKPLPPPE
jgi:hypothetical protein